MQLYSVNTGHFKLDGGAMFGVVPKSIWNRLNPADENNMCSWAMRSLLIESGDRLILVDNGMGNKQDEKFFSYYYLHGQDTLDHSLAANGFSRNDITDVVLTHLHFDHCGGSIERNAQGLYEPAFKNARFHVHEDHWNWAIAPNPREKASFLKENILPIQASGQLNFINTAESLIDGVSFIRVDGHTEAMLLPKIQFNNRTLLFMADLIPSVHHLPLPYVMSYDIRPLSTMTEKVTILNQAAEENWMLFFEHDPVNECALIEKTDKGVRAVAKGNMSELL
jgi:glyoxylase-like metal-dependent hydrolase (beta-lactamase superfamily II)